MGITVYTPEVSSGDEFYSRVHSRVFGALNWRNTLKPGPKDWKRYIELYKGEHYHNQTGTASESNYPKADSPNNNIVVNLTQSIVQDFIAFLTRNPPSFAFRPNKGNQSVIEAKIGQELLNTIWVDEDFDTPYEACLLDGFLIGHMVAETGFITEADVPRRKTSGNINFDSRIKEDVPYLRRTNPFYFIHEPPQKLHNARWCAELILMPAYSIIENNNYNNEARDKVESGEAESFASFINKGQGAFALPSEIPESVKKASGSDPLIICVKYFDRRFNKYMLFASNVLKPLVERELPHPYLDNFPYVYEQIIPNNDSAYSQSTVGLGEDQQLELDRTRATGFRHRRIHALRKLIILKNSFSASEREKLLSDDDDVIESKLPPRTVAHNLESPPLPEDQYRQEDKIINDFFRQVGYDELLASGSLPSRTSAREIQARVDINIGTKLGKKVRKADKFALNIGKQLWAHLKENLSTSQLVEIVSDSGEVNLQEVTPAVLSNEYRISILSSSREDHDPVNERAQRTTIWQTVVQTAQLAQQGGFVANIPAATKWMLESYPQKDQIPQFYRELTDEEKLAQLEAALANNNNKAASGPAAPKATEGGRDARNEISSELAGGNLRQFRS